MRFPVFLCTLMVSLITMPAGPASAWTNDQQGDIRWREGRMHDERWRLAHPGGIVYPPIIVSPVGRPPPFPAPMGAWYRCDNPAGYYPYIGTCLMRWRLVAGRPIR
jgi:hypothetical protein